jgi:hypothetical protein
LVVSATYARRMQAKFFSSSLGSAPPHMRAVL